MKRISLKKPGIVVAFGLFAVHTYGQASLQDSRQAAQALSGPTLQLATNRPVQAMSNEQQLALVTSDSVRIVSESPKSQAMEVTAKEERNKIKAKKQTRTNWFGSYLLAKIASKFNE